MQVTLNTAPTLEPLDHEEVKQHLQIEHDDDDAFIIGEIKAARIEFESLTGRRLISQAVTIDMDADEVLDASEIVVPIGPVITLTSVKWRDASGSLTALVEDTDFLSLGTDPMILDALGSYFTAYRQRHAFEIKATVGYGTARASVPKDIRNALMIRVADMFEIPTSKLIGTVAVDAPVTFDQVVDRYRHYTLI